METLVINIPDKKSALVKQLLKELGVTISNVAAGKSIQQNDKPNALTAKTIENAHKGIGLDKPIKNVSDFINGL
jgi:predicted subunit of tRNA(5-methylaminomethyl-2-thiouridylate) methyltransferase